MSIGPLFSYFFLLCHFAQTSTPGLFRKGTENDLLLFFKGLSKRYSSRRLWPIMGASDTLLDET